MKYLLKYQTGSVSFEMFQMDGQPQRDGTCGKSKLVVGDVVNYTQFIEKVNQYTKREAEIKHTLSEHEEQDTQ